MCVNYKWHLFRSDMYLLINRLNTVEFHLSGRWLPDRLGRSGKFVYKSSPSPSPSPSTLPNGDGVQRGLWSPHS